MNIKTIILDSEKNFLNYVESHSIIISKIIIFEDNLDGIIYFYCYNKYGLVLATSELSKKDFSSYKRFYRRLAKKFNFSFSKKKCNTNAIILINFKNKNRCI